MTFSEAVRTVYKDKYATFSGRASRSEYWWSALAIMLFLVVAIGVISLLVSFDDVETGNFSVVAMIAMGVLALVYIAAIIPLIAVVVRRFHDRDMSGWWYLGFIVIGIIPYVGIFASIAMLVIFCLKGTEGENRFGPDPLNPSASSEVFA